jgi:hypothetical protein
MYLSSPVFATEPHVNPPITELAIYRREVLQSLVPSSASVCNSFLLAAIYKCLLEERIPAYIIPCRKDGGMRGIMQNARLDFGQLTLKPGFGAHHWAHAWREMNSALRGDRRCDNCAFSMYYKAKTCTRSVLRYKGVPIGIARIPDSPFRIGKNSSPSRVVESRVVKKPVGVISVTQPLLEDWSPTLAGGLRPQNRD